MSVCLAEQQLAAFYQSFPSLLFYLPSYSLFRFYFSCFLIPWLVRDKRCNCILALQSNNEENNSSAHQLRKTFLFVFSLRFLFFSRSSTRNSFRLVFHFALVIVCTSFPLSALEFHANVLLSSAFLFLFFLLLRVAFSSLWHIYRNTSYTRPGTLLF